MLISGNVMIDGRAMTGPGGVVLKNDEHLDVFRTQVVPRQATGLPRLALGRPWLGQGWPPTGRGRHRSGPLA